MTVKLTPRSGTARRVQLFIRIIIIYFMHHSNIAVAPKPLASKAMRLVL